MNVGYYEIVLGYSIEGNGALGSSFDAAHAGSPDLGFGHPLDRLENVDICLVTQLSMYISCGIFNTPTIFDGRHDVQSIVEEWSVHQVPRA